MKAMMHMGKPLPYIVFRRIKEGVTKPLSDMNGTPYTEELPVAPDQQMMPVDTDPLSQAAALLNACCRKANVSRSSTRRKSRC